MHPDKKLFITGGSGLLGINWGYQLKEKCESFLNINERKIKPRGLQTTRIPLNDSGQLAEHLDRISTYAVIHTAGITNIELCESNPALARHVNVEISRHVSEACRELGITMIHISTDNLFDGTTPMLTEDAPVNPVNVYGQTKAEAEQVIQECYDDVIIIRTNFYGWGPVYKPSFSDTIISSLRKGGEVSLFEDVNYTPILISDLVNAAHDLLDTGHRGIFHVVGDERLSKLNFGHCVAEAFGLDASLISAGRLNDKTNLASRPYDMSLSNEKTKSALGRSLGTVTEQLTRLKQQENSNLTRLIHEVDSIR